MRLISSSYNEKEGFSYVMLEHKKRTFIGKSTLCEEDKEYASRFTGCRYAEMKAKIKALKYEYKEKKRDCEACRKFVNAMMQYKDFDKNSKMAKQMFRQLAIRIKAVNKLADAINDLQFQLGLQIRKQDQLNNKLSKRD